MNAYNGFQNKKNEILKIKNIYFLFLIFFIFLIDRLSKNYIINNFNENIFYLNDFLNIDLIWNTGIGFGFLSTDSPIIYNSITSSIGCVIIFLLYLVFVSKIFEKIVFATIIGGALGNFYDRIFFKAVPDFIDVHYQNFHWFTFNCADLFISIGIILFLVKDIFKK